MTNKQKKISPPFLKKGDKIAIVSPASRIKHEFVDGACDVLRSWGFEPVVSKHCKGNTGYYSGTVEQRADDLRMAFEDDSIKAILCSRGGYGVVHLTDEIPATLIRKNPKWVIGYSDISILHSMMVNNGVMSLHAPMAKHLTQCGADDKCSRLLRDLLFGYVPQYELPYAKHNRYGEVEGELVGGNLAVLTALIGTDVELLVKDKILFIEDIGEEIYQIERMLYNLQLAGILEQIRGLIVGQFTILKFADLEGETMDDMIARIIEPYSYPVMYDFPVGHVDNNVPLIEGAQVRLSVRPSGSTLQFK